MHYSENAMNPPSSNQQNKSDSSSSTDSGVIIIDNKTFADKTKLNQNHNKISDTQNETNSQKKISSNNTNTISVENTVNLTNNLPKSFAFTTKTNRNQSTIPDFATSSHHSTNSSPSVSIRSTSRISIVSIDENAIDSSSVADSDSDIDGDGEGVHSNYIVKKLGQQTTFPPGSSDLPNINKGLTVISQTISPGVRPENLNGCLNVPNTTNVLATPTTPSTPQIGSIALSNSTDVTFGDKHFYEGPVTIQQFLIDSKEKRIPTHTDGHDNPLYSSNGADFKNNGSVFKENSSPSAQQPHKFTFKRKAFLITGASIVLIIAIGIVILSTNNFYKQSINKNDDENYTAYELVDRSAWNARTAKGKLDQLNLPVHRVVISHTASDNCYSIKVCSFRVQIIQNFHMDSLNFDDVGYNFLIGGDGRVYVGRGWNNQGAFTKGYNRDSIGISFIGTYTTIQPTKRQIASVQLLLEEGVRLNKLVPDYRLYGHRQLSGTESPGEALYKIIKTWPNWTSKVS